MLNVFFKRYGWRYIPGMTIMFLSSWIFSQGPIALGRAIDVVGGPAPQWVDVRQAVLIILAIAAGTFVTRFAWRMIVIGNARLMENYLRDMLIVKFQSLPASFFANTQTGDLMAYAVNDVGAVRMTFGAVIGIGVNGVVVSVLSVYNMIKTVDARIALLSLIPIPFAVVTVVILSKKVQLRFRRVQELFARVSGQVNETINGVRIIKSFAREDMRQASFSKVSTEMKDAGIALSRTSSWMSPLVTFMFGVSYTIALIIGGRMVLAGNLSVGGLVTFTGCLIMVQNPITQLVRVVNLLQRGLASLKRLRTIYDEPSVPAFEMSEYISDIAGEIEVKDLSFTYPGASEPALRGISFKIPKGTSLGVAGGTGGGKTTVATLLLKHYAPPPGTMFLDGTDVLDIPAKAIREISGYVPQDGFLFSDTIKNNIDFYSGASWDEIVRAAKIAQIDGDVTAFRNGYETEIGERGTRLSGGQKQRLALARALVRNPTILILDDTLSAVDNVTEKLILEELSKEIAARTSIIIGHRLSALAACDNIIYIDNGIIAEQGTHEELLALDGLYAAVFREQQKGGGETN